MVVVAHAYLPDAGSPEPASPGTGAVARFATTDHYEGLRTILGDVATMLRNAGHRAEVLVDDNLLVDRAAAVRAGVGWWGKSTLVLVPGAGPWVLLGTVVTDAYLDVPVPMRRDCGTCSACLPACPTGALISPGVLDARLCIAYWAQTPGVVPRELRAAMADRIYGCESCLDACPPGHRLLDLGRSRSRGRVDLIAALQIDDAALLERFTHFFVPQRRARYLRRNMLIAPGNIGGEPAVPVVAGYAGHPDWLLRAHAVGALGSLLGPRAGPLLAAVAASETHGAVLDELSAARTVLS